MLIPINFLSVLLCLLLLIKCWRAGWPWRTLLLLGMLHSIIAGCGVVMAGVGWHRLQPVTAMMLPVLCQTALARQQGRHQHVLLSALSVLSCVALSVLLPPVNDVLIPLVWFGCALWMLRSLSAGLAGDGEVASALKVRGWYLMVASMITIGTLDAIISLLCSHNGGAGVTIPLIVGNLFIGALLSLTLILTPSSQPVTKKVPRTAGEDDAQILLQLEVIMQEGLYRHSDLNLAMLARKMGVPARHISAAVNTLCQQSVSQYVNGWRIKRACEQLGDGNRTVIDIMESVGFTSKSNFNREFQRICGTTPTAWRKVRQSPEIIR